MSLRYRNEDGSESIVSGLTPGGDIEAGAVMTRTGNFTIPAKTAAAAKTVQVTFSEPMPDDIYIIDLEQGGGTSTMMAVTDKTANGFKVNTYAPSAQSATTVTYIATKTYTIQHAEETANALNEIQAMIPASASSTNPLSTKSDLQAVNRSLDMRLDDVEDVIPSDATIANKLATADDVAEAMANAGLKVVDTIPVSPQDGDVVLYIGATTTDYTKGGIYQYDSGTSKWILISTAEVDLSNYATTFVGTKAQWEALTASQKAEYTLVDITDDSDDRITPVEEGTLTFATNYDSIVDKTYRLPYVRKQGNVVDIYFAMSGALPSSRPNGDLVATIPEGFRPSTRLGGFYMSATNSSGNTTIANLFFNVEPDGRILMWSTTTTAEQMFIHANIFYIIGD